MKTEVWERILNNKFYWLLVVIFFAWNLRYFVFVGFDETFVIIRMVMVFLYPAIIMRIVYWYQDRKK